MITPNIKTLLEQQTKDQLNHRVNIQNNKPKDKPSYITINGLKVDLDIYSRLVDFSTISGKKVNKLINFAIKRFLSDLPSYDRALLTAIKNRRSMEEVVIEPKEKNAKEKNVVVRLGFHNNIVET